MKLLARDQADRLHHPRDRVANRFVQCRTTHFAYRFPTDVRPPSAYTLASMTFYHIFTLCKSPVTIALNHDATVSSGDGAHDRCRAEKQDVAGLVIFHLVQRVGNGLLVRPALRVWASFRKSRSLWLFVLSTVGSATNTNKPSNFSTNSRCKRISFDSDVTHDKSNPCRWMSSGLKRPSMSHFTFEASEKQGRGFLSTKTLEYRPKDFQPLIHKLFLWKSETFLK